MIPAHDGDQLHAQQQAMSELRGDRAAVHHGHVKLPRGERGQLRPGPLLAQPHGDTGMVLTHPHQRPRQHVLAGRKVVADVDRTGAPGGGFPGGQRRLVHLGHDRPRLHLERPAGRGEPHLVRGAGDQLDAQCLLQPLELQAQRRLGEVQLCRRPPEMQLLRDRQEGDHVPEFHRNLHSRCSCNRHRSGQTPGKSNADPGGPPEVGIPRRRRGDERGRGPSHQARPRVAAARFRL